MTFFFFFNDTATTEIYTLSLHDALPISPSRFDPTSDRCALTTLPPLPGQERRTKPRRSFAQPPTTFPTTGRSEEHTSELQSPCNLVCRLLLEKKTTTYQPDDIPATRMNA